MPVALVHSIAVHPDTGPCEVTGRLARPRMRPYIAGYSGFRAAPGEGPLRRMLPFNFVTLIVDFDGGGSVVTGPRGTAEVYRPEPWRHGVSIGLTPVGAAALLGTPMSALSGAVVPPDALVGRRAALLADRLAGASGWAERFAILDAALASWVCEDTPNRAPDEAVGRAWWSLQASRVTIGGLADTLGVSRRYLEIGFRRRIGLSPKAVARVARFQRAVGVLARTGVPIGAAVGCGYADQPHLTREVRALAGITPRELRAFLQHARPPAEEPAAAAVRIPSIRAARRPLAFGA